MRRSGRWIPVSSAPHFHLLFYFAVQCNYLYCKICNNVYMENYIAMTAEIAFLVFYKYRKSKEMHLISVFAPNFVKNQSQALQQVNFLEKLLGQKLKSGPNEAILTY